MASKDPMNNWVLIQQGVREAERLMGQKEYNLSMVKARQTLEFMVKCLAERSGLEYGELIDTIDELYKCHTISKATCEHYHKIRMIGNKAVHEQDSNAYNANTAYHLLSQEVYTFANDYNPRKRSRIKRSTPKANTSNSTHSSEKNPQKNTRYKKSKKGYVFTPYDLLKILIPILIVILLISIIHMLNPKDTAETTAEITTEALTYEVTTEVPTTEAPTTEAVVYATTDSLNVRSAPSTDGDKLATLAAGTIVDYVGAYDDEWAIINYDGGQAYVASRYLIAQ